MRQVALIPVFCALLVSTMGFLPGIERDDGISMRATPSRKAIPVRPPSLPEALGHGRSGILSLLLQAGVDSDAGEKGGPGSLMLSLHGGSLHLPAREKREESAVHVAVLEGRVDVLSHLLAAGGSPADRLISRWAMAKRVMESIRHRTSFFWSRKYSATVSALSATRCLAPGGSVI